MNIKKNFFLNKKILIYGTGKSGISVFNFLKDKNRIYVFDDNKLNIKSPIIKHHQLTLKDINLIKFDHIIISPGIDFKKCKLSRYLQKNLSIIKTDLDIFYSFYQNKSITITGTNGKSTTAKIMYEILLNHKLDVRLVGNIGNPILSEKKIKKKTIFVIEASSYQLEYSMIFKSKYAVILNISPDHLERHKTLKNYVKAKFKLISNQPRNSIAFVKKDNSFIDNQIKIKKFNTKIIRIEAKNNDKILKIIDNQYFSSTSNKENLSFVLEISKRLKLKKNNIIKTLKQFKGLKYRQQIIYKKKKLTIINDSKSTSYSSSESLLKSLNKVYWILGGIPKVGDKFQLSKKECKNIKGFIFGQYNKKFQKDLSQKVKLQLFKDLKTTVKKIFLKLKKNQLDNNTILFSPCGASFDAFKNFEERGDYFNRLIKEELNAIK